MLESFVGVLVAISLIYKYDVSWRMMEFVRVKEACAGVLTAASCLLLYEALYPRKSSRRAFYCPN